MESIPAAVFQIVWIVFVFWMGACIGSLINVVVARLPLEKSIIWPGSRCGSCLQPIRGFCNIPIFSYLILRGRCRTCGASYSSRYMWVELLTGVAFAGLYYLDVLSNWHKVNFVIDLKFELSTGSVSIRLWLLFIHHAVLLSFLIAAALCDLDGRIIPLPLTVAGTLVGLLFAVLLPWPWPNQVSPAAVIHPDQPWFFPDIVKIPRGIYAWPVWGPLPSWLPPGSWQLGLATGLAGAAVGNVMMRTVRFLFQKGMGMEAMGLGDADLMMMAGAFLGWQMVVISFFVGTFASLLFIPFLVRKGDNAVPFGPGLALGVVVTLLAWSRICDGLQKFFFEPVTMFIGATIMGGGMFAASLMLRRKHAE